MIDPCLAHPDDTGRRNRAVDRDARTIRERQGELRAAIDRATGMPGVAAARRLVSVYNGGSMPNQPDHIFLARPVELDGTEVEGGLASPNANSSSTIPVVVLWHAPNAGDILIATSVGGRWVAERGGIGGTKLCVAVCEGLPVFGALITILSGSKVIATCTTDASGCCQLSVSGTYTVQVTIGGTLEYSSARTLTPGGTTAVYLGSNSSLVCCGGYVIPQILTLTDAVGTLTLAYDPNYSYPLWTGGHSVQLLSCSVTTPNNICTVAPPSEGPVRVCYQMICNAGQNPMFAVQRSWSWVYRQGALTPIWYQDSTGFTPGQFCITAPPPICGNPLTDTASFGANPSSANPFVLSGTPIPAPSNATGDPVGGTIAISA